MLLRMDSGSGIAQIQAKFSDSLEKLKLKETELADMETQLHLDQQKLEEDRDRLIEERRRVSVEEERFLKEKALMGTFPVDESDIIELNVQGTFIQTQRSTLTQARCCKSLDKSVHSWVQNCSRILHSYLQYLMFMQQTISLWRQYWWRIAISQKWHWCSVLRKSILTQLKSWGLLKTKKVCLITQLRDTYLAGLFDGQPKSNMHRDREGRVFLDYIPTTFRLLLDYLTELKLSQPNSSIPLPQIPDCHTAEFSALLKHLGLEKAIYGSPERFSRTLKSSTIVLRNGGMSATSTSDVMGYILGKNLLKICFLFQSGCVLCILAHCVQGKNSYFSKWLKLCNMIRGRRVPQRGCGVLSGSSVTRGTLDIHRGDGGIWHAHSRH